MINILNHNTTYKHSKFSARPGYAMAHNIQIPHSSQEILATYASKELLCWRFDLTFFNLQGFFLNMLKALHTCWTFAKNNKTIVFVSTDNPVDTGISESIDILTQKFPRDCLPRIQTQYNKHFRDVWSNDRYYYASRTAQQKITKKENDYDRSDLLHDPLWQRKNQEKTRKLSHDRVQVINSNKTPDKIGRRHGSEILSELKKLTSALEFKKHPKTEDVSENLEHAYLADWAYHKCDGLLYKAASRRLTASFSHMPASFFSNPKKLFQEKFGHVNSYFFENMKHEKNKAVKMLWPLNLNKSCFAKPGAAVQSKTQEQRRCPWIRLLGSNESDKIQQFLKLSPLDLQRQYDIMHTKKAQYNIHKMHHQKFSKKQDGTLFQDSRWRSPGVRSLIDSEKKKLVDSEKKKLVDSEKKKLVDSEKKKLVDSEKKEKDACLKKPNLATVAPFMDKWKTKSSLSTALGNTLGNTLDHDTILLQDNKYKKKAHQNKPHGLRQWSRKIVKSYKSYDFYQKLVHIQNDDATKRYACNPYLQHADLVFFTNADKDNGLASQITKLGIPSIGIVSGLKTSSYRKQPHQRNLHDSVTFPIVGNPENIPFVTMIVRVFVTLVQKTYNTKFVHRAPASSVLKSLMLGPKKQNLTSANSDKPGCIKTYKKEKKRVKQKHPLKEKKRSVKVDQKHPVTSEKGRPLKSEKKRSVKVDQKHPVTSEKKCPLKSEKKHSAKVDQKQPPVQRADGQKQKKQRK